MTDNELLLAISDIMDKKLEQHLKNDMQSMKKGIRDLKDDMQNLKDEMQNLRDEMQNLKGSIQDMKTDIISLQDNIHIMKLCQENIIMPRLNTIESCYTDTYKRYKDHSDKMQTAFEDIEVLKSVVSDHSKKLQKIS